jgi:outer membrane protein assembly factor BamB
MNYREGTGPKQLLVVATQVTALDRDTGAILWTQRLPAAARRFVVDDQVIFVFDGDGDLHCFDLQSGRLVGRVNLGLRTANVLLVDGDRLYASSDSEVVTLDRRGTILWRTKIPANASFSLCGLAIPGGPSMQPDFSRSG